MPEKLELSHLQRERLNHENEKHIDGVLPSHMNHRSPNSHIKRKLLLYLLGELVISLLIIYKYGEIIKFNVLLAPTLLSSSTAALAQSINQYQRKKFNFRRICKFIVWGLINGSLTELWFNMLRTQFERPIFRIIVDQSIGGPGFQIIFHILSNLWETGEVGSIFSPILYKSLKYSYCFWPFFSIGAFVFLPSELMFPSYCLANLVWNIILSKISNTVESKK